MDRKTRSRKTGKIMLKILGWFAGIWAAILIIIQIVLSPAFLTKVLNGLADGYIDGKLEFGRVSASVFRHFPNVSVTLDSVSLTYPGDRFAQYDSTGVKSRLFRMGKGEEADTLASFSRFSAAINLASLASGKIHIPYAHLDRPRIFAKSYNDSTSNWNMLTASGEAGTQDEEETKTSSDMPEIVIGKLLLDNSPLIVYCSKQDTLSAAVRVEKLGITRHRRHYDFELHARTGVYMPSAGRLMIPIDVTATAAFPKDTVLSVAIRELDARIAGIPLKADADVRYMTDSLYIKASASIDDCKFSEVLKYCGKNIWEGAGEITTDAVLNMGMNIDGWYSLDGSRLPQFDIVLNIPDAGISHPGIGIDSRIGADIIADGSNPESVDIKVNDLHFNGKSMQFRFAGSADGLLGKDPVFDIDGNISASLDSLGKFLDPESGLKVSGILSAMGKGKIRMSQMDMYKFAEADLTGFIKSERIELSSAKDTLDVHIDSLDVILATTGNTRDTTVELGTRMLAIVASMDSTSIHYKQAITLTGKSLSLKAQNDAAILDPKDSSSYYPFGGRLEIGRLFLMDSDSSRVVIRNSDNIFKMSPSASDKKIPVLTLKSKNGAIRLSAAGNRLSVRDMDINATATKSSARRKQAARKFVDSLSREYPDVPRDSLFTFLRSRQGARAVPEWMSEQDFRKNDFDFKLDESLAKYYKEWDFSGDLSVKRISVMTPVFPLRTSISNFSGKVSNNEINLKSFTLKSGTSDISATGRLSGLQRALLRNGTLNLSLDLQADKLNFNELIGAYTVGAMYGKGDIQDTGNLDDDEYQKLVSIDTLENVAAESSLIVIPANLNADISFEATDVSYNKLEMGWAAADIKMKERCLQIRNTVASTNIGDLYFEGFYSTRTKQDLKTGFNLSLSEVTAEKVIDMVPAIDSIMPMLKSFKGLLDCEMAATAQLDTSMNIMMPTLNGVIRIGGRQLGLEETENLYKVLKLLKFKNVNSINIDQMSAEGIISDNTLEIFPFVLSVDRYSVAMSGIQNMDQSFRYHISVLKSPLLIRFGLDLWGDFDDFKFKIGKAKYKNAAVPVFSAAIDETKLNLSNAIRNIFSKGADEAVRENEKQAAINGQKEAINYENAATSQMEELSADETRQLEKEAEESAREAAPEDAEDGGNPAEGTEGDGSETETGQQKEADDE